MKSAIYSVMFSISDEKSFSKENTDLVMKLINEKYREIEEKVNEISEKSPIKLTFSNVICFFVDSYKSMILGCAILDIFDDIYEVNLNEVMKSYITDDSINEAINGYVMFSAYSRALENMFYDDPYKRGLALTFAKYLQDMKY